MIRNAAIAGVLHGADGVNRINASAAAAERGIRVQEDKREHDLRRHRRHAPPPLHWSRKGDRRPDGRAALDRPRHRPPRPLPAPALLRRHRHRGRTRRHAGHHPQPGRPRRHRPHRHHPRRSQAEHRQLRPRPRQARSRKTGPARNFSSRVPEGHALAVVQLDISTNRRLHLHLPRARAGPGRPAPGRRHHQRPHRRTR